MITRIVKLHFKSKHTAQFIAIFEEKKKWIRSHPGCLQVDLLRDLNNPNRFFTISIWKSESDLEAYRASDLFIETWSQVKKWFNKNPKAWSTFAPDSSNELLS